MMFESPYNSNSAMPMSNMLAEMSNICDRQKATHICYKNSTFYGLRSENCHNFLLNYCNSLKQDVTVPPDIGEVIGDVFPVTMRFRLTFENQNLSNGEYYDDSLIPTIVYHLQGVIKDTLNVTGINKARRLICCVLESDAILSYQTSRITSEIRLQFPFCKCEKEIQWRVIIPALVNRLRGSSVIRHFIVTPIGDWVDIIMKDFTDIPMFGSVEDENGDPVQLRSAYREITLDELKEEAWGAELQVSEIFDPRDHTYVSQNLIDESIFDQIPDVVFWLPLLFSVNFCAEVTHIKKVSNVAPSNIREELYKIKGNEIMHSMELAQFFISLWKPARFQKFLYWSTIGEALFNVSEGRENGLDEWVKISNHIYEVSSPDFPPFLPNRENIYDDCCRSYDVFADGRITIRSLAWHALEDSPEKFNAWFNKWVKMGVMEAHGCGNYEVAESIYRLYWMECFCHVKNQRDVKWYCYQGNRLHNNFSAFRSKIGRGYRQLVASCVA